MYPKSDHYDGRRFHNLDKSPKDKYSFIDIIKWKWKEKAAKWPKYEHKIYQNELPLRISDKEVYITFINHSTELIQLQHLNIITDPVFSMRVGPFSQVGLKRVQAPGLVLKDLPKIDLVLLSHNHYDHFDLPSLQLLNKHSNPLFIIPLGNAHLLKKVGITRFIEMDWWDKYLINDTEITFTPAQHWSARGLRDHCKSLWGAYFISSADLKIYFAGDSGYNTHFKEIYKRYGPIDVSMLPIGAYEPRWFMHRHHMHPEEAVQAHLDLHSRLSIGMHYGTFPLANEGIEDPIIELIKSCRISGLKEREFITPSQGQTIKYCQLL